MYSSEMGRVNIVLYSFWKTERRTNFVTPAETGLSDSFLAAVRKKVLISTEHVSDEGF